MTDDFYSGSYPSLNINYTMVFVLLLKYDQVCEDEESEKGDEAEMA